MMRTQWKVVTVSHDLLEATLNDWEKQNWVIFQVIPTLKFETIKVVMTPVAIPKEIQYNIVLKRTISEDNDGSDN